MTNYRVIVTLIVFVFIAWVLPTAGENNIPGEIAISAQVAPEATPEATPEVIPTVVSPIPVIITPDPGGIIIDSPSSGQIVMSLGELVLGFIGTILGTGLSITAVFVYAKRINEDPKEMRKLELLAESLSPVWREHINKVGSIAVEAGEGLAIVGSVVEEATDGTPMSEKDTGEATPNGS